MGIRYFAIIVLGILLLGCTQQEETEPFEITLEEVSKHNTPEDCWFIIDGKVYDVSDFPSHPGSSAMHEGCGKDATELFETRPTGSGTPHSQFARSMLGDYHMGNLNE